MARKVESSRVLRYSPELMGAITSPGRVGLGPPSPKSPWHGAQFEAKSSAPSSWGAPAAAASGAGLVGRHRAPPVAQAPPAPPPPARAASPSEGRPAG